MPDKNSFLAKTINPSPHGLMTENKSSTENSKPITINFDGDRKALLDLNHPPASTWAEMIDYFQKNNRPVYVETDAKTNVITRLCIPEAARVWEIKNTKEDVADVSFHTSSALYHLRRDHPGFQAMLDALQTAKNKDETVLVTSTPRNFEIIDVRAMPSSFGDENQVSFTSPEPVEMKPVSPEKAQELFALVAGKSCIAHLRDDSCIPFLYPYNGCWIRAHMACYLMRSKGEVPGKIWCEGTLQARSSNVPECRVKWAWHVAATLLVKQKVGDPVLMVLDPSMHNELLTTDEWKKRQTDPEAKLRETVWTQYERYSGTADLAKANNEMKPFRILLKELWKDEGPPPYQCEI